jgi:hypothetical protein
LLTGDLSLTSLPHHGNVKTFAHRKSTDLSFCDVFVPVTEIAFSINIELKIHERTSDFGVDKNKLLCIEIFDQTGGGFWIKPHVREGILINDRWLYVEDSG